MNVIELKRPKHRISVSDIDQLFQYVAFVRTQLGNSPERPYADAAGYIVGGEEQDNYVYRERRKVYSSSRIYVRKYNELLTLALRLHDHTKRKIDEFEEKRKKRLRERNHQHDT